VTDRLRPAHALEVTVSYAQARADIWTAQARIWAPSEVGHGRTPATRQGRAGYRPTGPAPLGPVEFAVLIATVPCCPR
jgi:hypothetical protein